MNKQLVRVAVPGPFLESLDYQVAQEVDRTWVGRRVLVPLGRRKVVGVVDALIDYSMVEIERLKPIIEVIDTASIFSDTLLSLIRWVSHYYHYPLGDCFQTALPKRLCEGKAFSAKKAPVSATHTHHKLTLNTEQQIALNVIDIKKFQVSLLEGITGSGKTEVYLQLIEQVIAQGKQALVLVPEIGLTPQTVERFQKRFSVPVVTLHSALTEVEKVKHWAWAFSGEAKIVIGTRSAVFVPFQQLGVIIVDEEHDLSFKQQNGLRYSAREVAIKRAQLDNIPIVLGSATPALESLYHALISKRYQHLVLSQRAGAAKPAQFQLIDMRKQPLSHGLSRPLIEACEQHLQQGGQVLLFLNRRGYAPVLMCHHCGWVAKCGHCDRPYTLHRHPSHLLCHHCARGRPVLKQCPQCESMEGLIEVGSGTERIEEALQQAFPTRSIVRIDRSATQKKGELTALLEKGHSGEADILIGTQMLAKGHHFSGVTMVGVIDADAGLFSSDFRAIERVGQLILQVSGRAGRESKLGEVYIQTLQPQHPLLMVLLKEGYRAFAQQLMQEREQVQWPPFAYLALFRAEAMDKRAAETFLQTLKKALSRLSIPEVTVLGPIPSAMPKRAGYHRFQLLLQSKDRARLHQALHQSLFALYETTARKIRWSLDIDPQEVG
jgi:primosomal protein N' (replication factor Y)